MESNRRKGPTWRRSYAVVVAVATGVGGYWFGTRQASPNAAPIRPRSERARRRRRAKMRCAGRKVLYWHDPMVPGQKFDKPGKSPFMDMDLVPVYADAAADEGRVDDQPAARAELRRAHRRSQGRLARSGFTAVGAVGIDERTIVAVQTRSPGYIERLRVRAQYDSVAAGQPLADLYVPEWLAARKRCWRSRQSAQPERGTARGCGAAAPAPARRPRSGDRARRARRQAGGARDGDRAGSAASSGRSARATAWRSCRARRSSSSRASARVWVIADVPEAQAALLAAGTPVEVRAAAFPDRVFKGSVATLLPEVNAQTRTVRARIVVANPGAALKPGMFANVAFRRPMLRRSVLVPAEAVIRTGTRDVVIVDAARATSRRLKSRSVARAET